MCFLDVLCVVFVGVCKRGHMRATEALFKAGANIIQFDSMGYACVLGMFLRANAARFVPNVKGVYSQHISPLPPHSHAVLFRAAFQPLLSTDTT